MNEVRARILKEATRIIASRGYDALSMRTLASAVGLTAGALYRYFPSKQDVLAAQSLAAVVHMTGRLQAIAVSGLAPLEAVFAMMVEYCRFGAEDRDRFRVLFMDAGANEQPIVLTGEIAAAFSIAQHQVQLCIELGQLKSRSAEAATQIIWACAHGLISLPISVPELEFGDQQTFFENGISAVLNGLRSERTI